MKIKINYTNNQHIVVQLFDNPAVRKWFEYFSTKNYNYKYQYEQIPPGPLESDIERQWQNIQNSIAFLDSIGLSFNLSETFDRQQSTLNTLHRFFTYNMLWYDVKDTTPNPFNPHFKLDNVSKEEWYKAIDAINQAVHSLERMIEPTANALSIDPPIKSLAFRPDRPVNLEWLQFNEDDFKQNYEYFNNTHYQHLVMLDRSILGKCVLQSFYSDDDPSAVDCTGRFGSHGGFAIDINSRRHQVYQSLEFYKWLEPYNLAPNLLPYEFPIGYVINLTTDANDYVLKEKFLNLEFLL